MSSSALPHPDSPPDSAFARWRAPGLVLAALLAAVAVLYADTALEAVSVWRRSDTHAFAALILPISLYFIWLRRAEVAALTPRPWPAAALLVLPAVAAWLVGALAQASVLAQFALVAIVQAAVLALLGGAIYRALLFPLTLLWLMVPFGESLLPALIQLTVWITAAALGLLGLTVQVEGNILASEAGRFAVVEACSALDFLIGNLVISLVFANLLYSGRRKQIVYVLAAVPVAVLANNVRTTAIIYITYLTGDTLDLARDHATFGWLLFCVAVALQMTVGWRFRDPPPTPRQRAGPRAAPASGRRLAATAGLLLAPVLAVPAVLALLLAGQPAPLPAALALCPPPTLGTAEADAWRPAFAGADGVLAARYRVDGQAVDLAAGYYAGLGAGREIVTWRNRVERVEGWSRLATTRTTARIDGAAAPVESIWLRGPGKGRRLAWQTYWVNGRLVAVDWQAKVLRVYAALLGRYEAASLLLSTDASDGVEAAAARLQGLLDRGPVLAPFVQAARSGAGC